MFLKRFFFEFVAGVDESWWCVLAAAYPYSWHSGRGLIDLSLEIT